jgi:hypothetical protein
VKTLHYIEIPLLKILDVTLIFVVIFRSCKSRPGVDELQRFASSGFILLLLLLLLLLTTSKMGYLMFRRNINLCVDIRADPNGRMV